ncbi:putative GPI-anchored protein 33 [Spathaspora sp. JA1]|nr:putative GPI-anchored protein 33 [Spathaspora sp. JA1]
MKSFVLLLPLLLQICKAADPAPAPAAPAAPAAPGAVTTPTTTPAAGVPGAVTTPTTTPAAGAPGAVTTPTTTPAAGAVTTPTTTPPAGAVTTPTTTPTTKPATTPTTTGTGSTTPTTSLPTTTTPTPALPANPATMNPSQLSQYSLTVTMNAAQLASFRATHTDPATTTTIEGPGVAGARVAPGVTPAAQNSPNTANDDTTKSLTFVTTRVLRSTSSAATEADAESDPSSASTEATKGSNGGYLNGDILGALKTFKSLMQDYPIQDQLDSKSKLTKDCIQIIDEIFSKDVQFSSDLLKEILILNLPSELNLKLINHYYRLNPENSTVIDKETALIALRNALFNGDFLRAIKISDVTVGHPNYIQRNHNLLKKGCIKLAGSALGVTLLTKFGINTAIDSGLVSSSWEHLVALNSVVLTYMINSTFLLSVVKFGRQMASSGGGVLGWQKGTFYTNWFKHADEMLFGAKIIEADRALNGGSNNPQITEELCRPVDVGLYGVIPKMQAGYDRDGNKIRLFEAKDNLEDLKFQAYWMSGGDGFEWVEPEQDPAEITWKEHIQQYHKPHLQGTSDAKALKWADELIDKTGDTNQVSS